MNLKNFRSWEKQHLRKFTRAGLNVYMVTEWNMSYGDLITKFQIGDEEHTTGVLPYWEDGAPLECSQSNNRIGCREFKHGSLTREFLWDALGLVMPPDEELIAGRHSLHTKDTSFHLVSRLLQAAGWERVI